MDKAFFCYWLDYEDLQNCMEVMDRESTPENLEKLKAAIMIADGSKLGEKLTETAFNFIYDEIEKLFPER